MKFEYLDEKVWRHDYPAFIDAITKFEFENNSIVTIYENAPIPHLISNTHQDQLHEMGLTDGTICWKCGSKNNVIYHGGCHEGEYICLNCLKSRTGYERFFDICLEHLQNNSLPDNLLNFKVRAFSMDNKFVYCKLKEIIKKDGKYFYNANRSTIEILTPTLYTGIRDATHERIYTNDILIGNINQQYNNKYHNGKLEDYYLLDCFFEKITIPWKRHFTNNTEACFLNYDCSLIIPFSAIDNIIAIGSCGPKGIIYRQNIKTLIEESSYNKDLKAKIFDYINGKRN